MVRLSHSGRIEYVLYLIVHAIEIIAYFVVPVSELPRFPTLSTYIFNSGRGILGNTLIFYSIPITIILCHFFLYKIASVNDSFLKIGSTLLGGELLLNTILYLPVSAKLGFDAFTHIVIKAILYLIMIIRNSDYYDSNRYMISYKYDDRVSYKRFIEFSKSVNNHFPLILFSCLACAIILTAVCVIFDAKWLLTFILMLLLLIALSNDISGYNLNVKNVIKYLEKKAEAHQYCEEFAKTNGLDLSAILTRLVLLNLIPIVAMYTFACLVSSSGNISKLFETIWIFVYASIIVFLVCYCWHSYCFIEMKNIYYEESKSGSVHKHRYDDTLYDLNLLSLRVEKENEQFWECSYRQKGKKKLIKIPKAYPTLFSKGDFELATTTQDAVKAISEAKKKRSDDFKPPMSEKQQKELFGSIYEQTLPYYAISDGFKINEEYRFLSYQKSIEETNRLREFVATNEGGNIGAKWIVVAEATNGDKVITNNSGRTISVSYDSILDVDVEWETLAAFICLSFQNKKQGLIEEHQA